MKWAIFRGGVRAGTGQEFWLDVAFAYPVSSNELNRKLLYNYCENSGKFSFSFLLSHFQFYRDLPNFEIACEMDRRRR